MLKKVLAGIMAMMVVVSSLAAASETNWTVLQGGKLGGEWAPSAVADGAGGIDISGQGSYASGEGSAAGVVSQQAVDWKSFTAEFEVTTVAGWGSEGADHWFNFNLLNKPAFFSLDNAKQAQGLVVLMRPYDQEQIDIEAYLLSEGSGFMGLGASRVSWSNTLKVELKANGDVAELSVNGQPIEADLSNIPDSLFDNGQAYFSSGASTQGEAKFGYVLKSVNGSAASLQGTVAAPVQSGTSDGEAAPAANPKTGDMGMAGYAALLVAAAATLGGLLLLKRRTAGTTRA